MVSLLCHLPAGSPPADGRLALPTIPDATLSAALVGRLLGGEWSARGPTRLDPTDGTGVRAAAATDRAVVSCSELVIDRPSRAPSGWLAPDGVTVLLMADPDRDWCGLARWRGSTLVRSLSLSLADGILENVGAPEPVEEPFWAGGHPVQDPDALPAGGHPLPFHPYELGRAAARLLVDEVSAFELHRT